MLYRLATPEDAESLARITHACAPELRDNFTMRMGLPFHRAYYKSVLAEPTTIVVCAENDGQVCGFALGTLDSAALLAAVKNARFALARASAWAVVSRPWLLAGLVRRALALVQRHGSERYVLADGAKVSFLAVDPSTRSAHAGPKLMKQVIAELRKAGAGAIGAEVDQSNPRVIRLHQRLGAAITKEFTTPNGVSRVILEYPSDRDRAAA